MYSPNFDFGPGKTPNLQWWHIFLLSSYAEQIRPQIWTPRYFLLCVGFHLINNLTLFDEKEWVNLHFIILFLQCNSLLNLLTYCVRKTCHTGWKTEARFIDCCSVRHVVLRRKKRSGEYIINLWLLFRRLSQWNARDHVYLYFDRVYL